MNRRNFLAGATAAVTASELLAHVPVDTGIHFGDRVAGQSFASRSTVWGRHGACATAQPLATLVGIDILRLGGSAIDAAIAVNAVLGLVEPFACGIGGDAFVMLNDGITGKIVAFNGSGRSPHGLSLELVRSRARNGMIPLTGAISVSVPGAVDAWGQLHARYGRLPLVTILAPAIDLAFEGFPVTQTVAHYLAETVRQFAAADAGAEEIDNFRATFAPAGKAPSEGEIFTNPDLGRTYQEIASGGPRSFYEGDIARKIEDYFKRNGGFITRDDLAAHRGDFVMPFSTTYRGVEVFGLGPNSQGLSTLQILNILENFDLAKMGFASVAAVHTAAEAKRLAFEDRARWFADPAFSKPPTEVLISKSYAQRLASRIRPDRLIDRIAPFEMPATSDTTYFTVADRNGMMVSWIQSNYRNMGSGLVPDRMGFVLQNRGQMFSLTDGSPNLYAPGKRPFHTIIPGYACKDGKPWLSFGVMGGDMQPQGQAQVLVNMIDHGFGLQEAGDAPRWRHERSTEPTGERADGTGLLRLERGYPDSTRAGLAALGWQVAPADGNFGGYQAIARHSGAYAAATEMRKDGTALAY